MFRLNRGDRLAMAVILLAAIPGIVVLRNGSGDLVRTLALTEVSPPAVPAEAATLPESAIALELASTGDRWPVTGAFAGRLSLEGGDLVFRVPEAVIRTRPGLSQGRTLVGVRLALARDSGTTWITAFQGPLVRLGRELEGGRVYELGAVELRVPGVDPSDLLDTWPVLVHELEIRSDDPAVLPTPAWTYVHGSRDALAALGRKADPVDD